MSRVASTPASHRFAERHSAFSRAPSGDSLEMRTEIVTTRTSLPGFDQCELTKPPHAAAAQGGVLH